MDGGLFSKLLAKAGMAKDIQSVTWRAIHVAGNDNMARSWHGTSNVGVVSSYGMGHSSGTALSTLLLVFFVGCNWLPTALLVFVY